MRGLNNYIIQRIPPNVKMVAEIRLMWADIVGEAIALRSQPVKFEFIPKKDEHGNPTGEYHKRLVVHVSDVSHKTAMTTMSVDYLEKIPNRYRVHSIRYMSGDVDILEPSFVAKTPVIEIPLEDKAHIIQKVQILPEALQGIMAEYLIICKYQQNKNS